jgi:hypothetical protein
VEEHSRFVLFHGLWVAVSLAAGCGIAIAHLLFDLSYFLLQLLDHFSFVRLLALCPGSAAFALVLTVSSVALSVVLSSVVLSCVVLETLVLAIFS